MEASATEKLCWANLLLCSRQHKTIFRALRFGLQLRGKRHLFFIAFPVSFMWDIFNTLLKINAGMWKNKAYEKTLLFPNTDSSVSCKQRVNSSSGSGKVCVLTWGYFSRMDIELFQSPSQLSSASGFRFSSDIVVGKTDTWVLPLLLAHDKSCIASSSLLPFKLKGKQSLRHWSQDSVSESVGAGSRLLCAMWRQSVAWFFKTLRLQEGYLRASVLYTAYSKGRGGTFFK